MLLGRVGQSNEVTRSSHHQGPQGLELTPTACRRPVPGSLASPSNTRFLHDLGRAVGQAGVLTSGTCL